jgi:large subunit ribosomal protein L23
VAARHVVRFTKSGILAGKKSSYKKAVVQVTNGQTIDIYSNL